MANFGSYTGTTQVGDVDLDSAPVSDRVEDWAREYIAPSGHSVTLAALLMIWLLVRVILAYLLHPS